VSFEIDGKAWHEKIRSRVLCLRPRLQKLGFSTSIGRLDELFGLAGSLSVGLTRKWLSVPQQHSGSS